MKIVDISGPIYSGMWTYGGTYGEVQIDEVPQLEAVEHVTYSWRMAMSVQSGTYLETSLHVDRNGPALIDIASKTSGWWTARCCGSRRSRTG
jgi:kynurenine formamidase